MSRHRLGSFLVALCHHLQDLFFPPTCVGCRELLQPFRSDDAFLCPTCQAHFDADRLPATDLLGGDPACLTHVALVAYHAGRVNGVSERLIYTLKHKYDRRLFAAVAEELKPRIHHVWMRLYIGADEVVWVYPPRRPSTIRKDGFDQAQKLAQRLAKTCGGTCLPLIERARRLNKEQKRLTAAERRKNTARMYHLPTEAIPYVQGKLIMLVDDVSTTGVTLRACAELMIQAGAEAVIWVTVAKT